MLRKRLLLLWARAKVEKKKAKVVLKKAMKKVNVKTKVLIKAHTKLDKRTKAVAVHEATSLEKSLSKIVLSKTEPALKVKAIIKYTKEAFAEHTKEKNAPKIKVLEKNDKKVKPALVSLKKAKVAVKAAIKRVSHAVTEGQKKRSKAAIKKAVKKVEVKKAVVVKVIK